MDEHELVVKVKQLALELDRTPTREEFTQSIGKSKECIQRSNFGNYSTLCIAAGLNPTQRPRKIDNSIFEKDIEKHIGDYSPAPPEPSGNFPLIASWSDVHRPFLNQRVQDRFLEYIGDEKPEYVFENGDGDDMFSHSKFPRSHNVFTPREERALSRKQSEEFWAEAKRRSPKSKLIKMLGNHDVRPMKRILEIYPAAEDWLNESLKRDFSYDGVQTIFDPREEFIIGDIAVFHGYRGKLGDHRDYTLFNCINGHTHVGGVSFRRIKGKTLWELNSGLSGDPEAKGLTYTPQRITNWTPGFGVVNKNGPQFIPV